MQTAEPRFENIAPDGSPTRVGASALVDIPGLVERARPTSLSHS